MTAQDELTRRISRDSICRAVQKKIDAGTADFTDTARYCDRAAELLGAVLAEYVPNMPPDERETLCKALLRQRYTDTNTMLNAVQRALDAAQGLHLAPQIADYPEERVEQAAHSLADETVPMETIQRRAKSAPATIARSFQDDYIEKNAAFRSSAGLKCYINRIAAGGCCKWCTAMAGRYRYGEEPEDVYRRHDNCSCTVTYESGRQRQDVWSKRTWEAPEPGAGAGEPVVFTAEQAAMVQAADEAAKRTILTQEQAAAAQARHPLIRFTEEQAEKTQESVLTRETFSDIIDIILADHQRNPELERTIKQCITQAAPVFAEDLAKFFSRIPAEENRYIMAMHGNPQAAFIYGMQVTPKIVASIIKHRKDYHGEEVVFIACNTGNTDNISECFAQQLANELGNIVHAPTRFGAINSRGEYYSSDITGLKKDGDFIPFVPRRDEK